MAFWLSLFDTMLNFVENLLENEKDRRSGPMNDQDHSLSLLDPDRSLVLSHFLTNFLQNLALCHTAFIDYYILTLKFPPKKNNKKMTFTWLNFDISMSTKENNKFKKRPQRIFLELKKTSSIQA
jgi:hypothetical protein